MVWFGNEPNTSIYKSFCASWTIETIDAMLIIKNPILIGSNYIN